MGQFSKRWEDLQFSDNFIFCKVLKNKELCIQFLEILLGIKIGDITYIESEHTIQDYYESRGIRMDVFVKDSDRTFNLEMQTGDYEDLLLRARYYQSAADISTTPRRTKYKELKESYIIFICKDDPFGQELPLYTEAKYFKETAKLPYNDKTHKLFYNTSAYAKVQNEEVRDVLEFIYALKTKSSFTRKLEASVRTAKSEPVFKDEYMYFEDILEEEKEEARATGLAEGRATGLAEGRATGLAEGRATGLAEGRATGLAEGRATGLAEGRAEGHAKGKSEGIEETKITNAKNAIKKGFNLKDISEITGLTLEQVQKLAEEIRK